MMQNKRNLHNRMGMLMLGAWKNTSFMCIQFNFRKRTKKTKCFSIL